MTDGYATDVILRSSESDTYDLWHILHAPMQVDSVALTLSEMGSITKSETGIDIRKKNQSYQIDVCFDFVGSYGLAKKAIDDAVNYMNNSVLPVGYKAETEEDDWYGVRKGQYAWLIFLIIAVLFVMLAMTFESLRFPLAVIFMIPISFIGLFLTFGLSSFSFDQGGFAALVMLCGIVVNAGIYLVTTYQRFGGPAVARTDAQIRRYVKAFSHKIIPISLTIASTVLGLLPFLSDGPEEVFWFDFAIGTIGGLIFSIIALVFYLPVFVIKRR
jgi:multidrug efflux pump subunit AcrB